VSAKAAEILDAAELRIRQAGYDGFSFRDIANDVGVKSASVHYHFPTKGALAAAVAKRYRERFLEAVSADVQAGKTTLAAWRDGFALSLRTDRRACLCGVLGVVSNELDPIVLAEVREFFAAGIQQLLVSGLERQAAERAISLLEGAMLIAISMDDFDLFDRVTATLTV
jgi:TetR/AcrR family transcriptional repressor of nem operon